MGKKRIAIVTDSNSGITQAQGREMGITVIAMPGTGGQRCGYRIL